MSPSEGKVGTTITDEMPPTHLPMTDDDALSRRSFSMAAALSRSKPILLPAAAAVRGRQSAANAVVVDIAVKRSAAEIWMIFMSDTPG